jgi:hypothetical protein
MNLKEYKDLTGFLLGPLRKRPGMFLGRPEISRLPNFILGYSIGFEMAKTSDNEADYYFGENGFLDWYFKMFPERFSSYWTDSFLIEANNDETLALEIFFNYLERYKNEKNCT